MTKKEQEYWAEIAKQVAEEEEKKAKAVAARGSAPPPPPELGQLVAAIVQEFSQGKGIPTTSVIGDVTHEATTSFVQTVDRNARERYDERSKLMGKRYTYKDPARAKESLDWTWRIAKAGNVTPTEIIQDPSELKYSAVAMELVNGLTSLKFDKTVGKNPHVWYQEAMRAYQSIGFNSLTTEEETELRSVFNKTLDHVRNLLGTLEEGAVKIPKDNTSLWRGFGDYYFSAPQAVLGEDPAVRSQKEALRVELKSLQGSLHQHNTLDQEKKLLSDFKKDFDEEIRRNKFGRLRDEVNNIQYRLMNEVNELNAKPEFGDRQGTNVSAEEDARAIEKLSQPWHPNSHSFQAQIESGLNDIDKAFKIFGGEENRGIRSELRRLDDVVNNINPFERYTPGAEEGRLRRGIDILESIDRRYKGQMSEDQKLLLETYYSRLRNAQETGRKRSEAPNRLYLTESELEALRVDPIGTSEEMFNDAMEAFVTDPDGPRAKFLLDRIELMQYFLFSESHSVQLQQYDVVIVDSLDRVTDAISTGGVIEGRKVAKGDVTSAQKAIDSIIVERTAEMGDEKSAFERSFIIRFHDILYIQQWKNADGFENETFRRYVNSRVMEEDYWGFDGQYGGLLKDIRMKLADKYLQKIVDPEGNRNAHNDKLWDQSIEELVVDLQDEEKYPDMVKKWSDYLDGEYFKPIPGVGGDPALKISDKNPLADKYREKRMKYKDAVWMLTRFASYRMIMGHQKYLLDAEFLPTRAGMEIGEITVEGLDPNNELTLPRGFKQQFLEKQKAVKLMNSVEGWILTWGGITNGRTGEEVRQLRKRAEVLAAQLPEINTRGDEWAKDWWDNKVQKFGLMKEKEQRRFLAELRWVFGLHPDKFDKPPAWKSPAKAQEWIKNFLPYDKLRDELRFYEAMRASAVYQSMELYFAVSESWARRVGQFDALAELLGESPNEARAPSITPSLTKQNFLTFTEVDAGRSYFTKKIHEDTRELKKGFLDEMSFIARYSPHSLMLRLREGESLPLRKWIEDHMGSQGGFSKFYGEVSAPFEDIFSRLALREQVDYSKGYNGLSDFQKGVVDKLFIDRFKGNAAATKKEYFDRMQAISDYLLKPGAFADYAKYTNHKMEFAGELGAIQEFTNIHYGNSFMHLHRDDYPYEYAQYPERALPIILSNDAHILTRALKKRGLIYQPNDADSMKAIYKEISTDTKLKMIWLKRVTDKNEPTSSQDEQSGLFRRNIRDLAAIAEGVWGTTGQRWNMSNEVSNKAREQTYNTIVGVSGNLAAAINDRLDIAQRLLVQLVKPEYGPVLAGMHNSSSIREVRPELPARMPDDLEHQFMADIGINGGLARHNDDSIGAIGLEYVILDKLRVSPWSKWLGGTTGRAELLNSLHNSRLIGPWARKNITEKKVEDALESLTHNLPLGKIGHKLGVVALAGLILFVIYSAQQASSGGEEKRRG